MFAIGGVQKKIGNVIFNQIKSIIQKLISNQIKIAKIETEFKSKSNQIICVSKIKRVSVVQNEYLAYISVERKRLSP
jgi:hypothetical protein